METYDRSFQKVRRALDSHPRASKQPPIHEIFQRMRDRNRHIPEVIQRYTEVEGLKISAGGKYKTYIEDTNSLWIREGDGLPSLLDEHLVPGGGGIVEGYAEYTYHSTPATNFVNDCGGFAEYLASGSNQYYLPEDREENYLFADGNEDYPLLENFDMREEGFNKPDIAANPDVGEAYFIKSDEEEPESGVHHVAIVIAKDGSDNITCEANAGNEGAEEPIFDMYGTLTTPDKQNQTFHKRYLDSFKYVEDGRDVHTIVGRKKIQ